jgi:hypothetical protein
MHRQGHLRRAAPRRAEMALTLALETKHKQTHREAIEDAETLRLYEPS